MDPHAIRKLVFTLALLALGSVSFLSHAFDWPVEDRVLMTTFGENRQGHFYTGIDLSGGEQEVYPIADGEIIFYYEEGRNYSSFCRGNGSFVALQHEGGIQSIYSHLKNGSLNLDNEVVNAKPKKIPDSVFKDQIMAELVDANDSETLQKYFTREEGFWIYNAPADNPERSEVWEILSEIGFIRQFALSGDTGMSEGIRLSLMIIDVEENKFLNPTKNNKPPLLPALVAPGDSASKGPVIEKVLLKRGSKILELEDSIEIPPGDAEILAEIYDMNDFVTYNSRMNPYRFYLSNSGRIATAIVFDSIEESGGRHIISSTDITCDSLYHSDWLYDLGRITLMEGRCRIQVGAEDCFGQESYVDLKVTVTSE